MRLPCPCGGFLHPQGSYSACLHVCRLFGGFQAIMPLAGWLGGRTLAGYIGAIDHWIAFGLLTLIGGK